MSKVIRNSLLKSLGTKKKIGILLSSFLILLVTVILLLGYMYSTETSLEDVFNSVLNKDSIPVKYITYSSEEYGYSFQYPENWSIEVVNLKKDEDYNIESKEFAVTDDKGIATLKTVYKHSALASYGDIELMILTRDDDWSIEIEAYKGTLDRCGGESSILREDHNVYKFLMIEDKYTVVRYLFEEGKYRIIPDIDSNGYERIPTPQNIQSYFVETLENGSDAYYAPFCISLPDIPLTLHIEYISNVFTYENMNSEFKVESSILSELDTVIESITFEKDSTYLNTYK